MSSVRVVIDADAQAVVVEAGKAKRAIRGLGDEAQRAAKAAGVYRDATGRWRESNGRLVSSTRQAALGLKEQERQTRRTAGAGAALQAAGRRQVQTLEEIGRAGRRASLGLGALAGAGLLKATKDGLQFNAQMESNKIALDQLTGSSAKADRLLADLFQTARKSPFEFADVTDAAKKFLAFGFSVRETKTSLDAIGNATAALGGGAEKIDRLVIAFGQIRAKGRVQGDELLQLAEAGVPAYQILAEKLHLSADQVKNIGKEGIKADVAIKALTEGINERFGGMTVRQSKSFGGLMSTMKDDYRQMTGAMTEGLFVELKRWAPAVDDAMQDITRIWGHDQLSVGEKFDLSQAAVDRDLGPLFDRIEQKFASVDWSQAFADALATALPVIGEAAGKMGVTAARGFFAGFRDADPVSKVILALFAAQKTGALAAVRSYGKRAGTEMGAGAAASAGATVGDGMRKNLAGRTAQFRAVGKGVLGAALFAGVADAATSSDLNGTQRFARVLSTASSDVLPDPKDETDKYFARVKQSLITGSGQLVAQKQSLFARLTEQAGVPTGGGLLNKLFGSADELSSSQQKAIAHLRSIRRAADQIVTGELSWKQFLNSKGFTQESEQLARQIFAAQGQTKQGAQRVGVQFADGLREGRRPTRRAVDSLIAVLESMPPRARQEAAQTAVGMARVLEQRGGLPRGSAKKIRDAVVHQFDDTKIRSISSARTLAAGVASSMSDLERTVNRGMGNINTVAHDALKKFGFGDFDLSKARPLSKTPPKPQRKATGGLMDVGRPGAAGMDTVPAILNGQRAVIAEGENVAVINRHQRAALDQRLADQGGLRGFFARHDRPHHMAAGGIVGLGRQLQGQGFQVSENPAFGGVHPVHSAGSYHYKGLAIDVNADGKGQAVENQRLDALNARLKGLPGVVELLWRVKGHFDHLHVAMTGGGKGALGNIGGSGGGGDVKIGAPKITGPDGVLKKLGQAALDQSAKAATRYVDSKAGSDSGGAGLPGGTSGENQQLGRRLMLAAGFDAGQWPALRELWTRESGWNQNARNPSSGAFGIPQALPPGKMGAAAAGGNAEAQIRWGLRYIRERYRTPSGALSFHDAHNWYAQGGLAPGYAPGGLVAAAKRPAKKPKKQPRKQKAPQHWRPKTPLKYVGRVAEAVPEIARITSLDTALERADRQYSDLARELGISEEDINVPAQLQAHVAELDRLLGAKAGQEGLVGQQKAVAATAARKVAEAIAERQERIREVLDSAKRNKRRILDTQKDAAADQRRKKRKAKDRRNEWKEQVDDNDQRIDSLQDDLRAETQKRHPDSGVKNRLRNQIDELRDESKRLRRHKPKDGDPRRDRRFGVTLDRLRDEREEMIGTRSTKDDADGAGDGGYLGRTRAGLKQYQEQASSLAEMLASKIPDAFSNLRLDKLELAAERAQWIAGPPPPDATPADTAAVSDSGLADLLKQQLQDSQQATLIANTQFGVFKGFAPLVSQRAFIGSYQRGTPGLRGVTEGGLALLHKDEAVIPDPQGPFLNQITQARAPVPAVNVQVAVQGDMAGLIRVVDARVDGRAAKVADNALGRRARLFTIAPGR